MIFKTSNRHIFGSIQKANCREASTCQKRKDALREKDGYCTYKKFH